MTSEVKSEKNKSTKAIIGRKALTGAFASWLRQRYSIMEGLNYKMIATEFNDTYDGRITEEEVAEAYRECLKENAAGVELFEGLVKHEHNESVCAFYDVSMEIIGEKTKWSVETESLILSTDFHEENRLRRKDSMVQSYKYNNAAEFITAIEESLHREDKEGCVMNDKEIYWLKGFISELKVRFDSLRPKAEKVLKIQSKKVEDKLVVSGQVNLDDDITVFNGLMRDLLESQALNVRLYNYKSDEDESMVDVQVTLCGYNDEKGLCRLIRVFKQYGITTEVKVIEQEPQAKKLEDWADAAKELVDQEIIKTVENFGYKLNAIEMYFYVRDVKYDIPVNADTVDKLLEIIELSR